MVFSLFFAYDRDIEFAGQTNFEAEFSVVDSIPNLRCIMFISEWIQHPEMAGMS
jgi:hypothetical protein